MAEPAQQGAASGHEPPESKPDASVPDPSMEDILASIRRILNDGDAAPGLEDAPPQHAQSGDDDDVFLLETSMMVDDAEPHESDHQPVPHELDEGGEAWREPPLHDKALHEPRTAHAAAPDEQPWEPLPEAAASSLLAPEAAGAASDSLGLLRGLHARTMPVNRGAGPTLEDIVRDELRPLLKAWLDEHLPPLVERLVHAEIERVSRSA